MAEEKKPSRADRMYGKSPRVKGAGDGGSTKQEEPAHKEAEKTAGSPEKSAPSPKKEPVKPTPAGGVEDGEALALPGEGEGGGQMPMAAVHDREMKDMHHRHERERRDMHTRHEQEHKEMRTRHESDGVPGGPGKEPEKEIGKEGTEPK